MSRRSGPGLRGGFPLRIESVDFVASAASLQQCPNRPLLEVAVSGRSNVGKSSLLNSLLARKRLARVSRTPGKTQLLNYFIINEKFHLVDLPGYGFARAPKSVRGSWRRMMQEYLRHREQLCAVAQLVDIRHSPSNEDLEMIEWLLTERLTFCLIPTKMDKLKTSERHRAVVKLVGQLDLPDDIPVVTYSSKSGEGRLALLDWLDAITTTPDSDAESQP